MGGIFRIQMVHLFDCTTTDQWVLTRDGSDLKRGPSCYQSSGEEVQPQIPMGRDRDLGNTRGNKY